MQTPHEIAHQVCGDWIMGPINMGDLEERLAAALRSYAAECVQAERERAIQVLVEMSGDYETLQFAIFALQASD